MFKCNSVDVFSPRFCPATSLHLAGSGPLKAPLSPPLSQRTRNGGEEPSELGSSWLRCSIATMHIKKNIPRNEHLHRCTAYIIKKKCI